jgi:hypothetical protein
MEAAGIEPAQDFNRESVPLSSQSIARDLLDLDAHPCCRDRDYIRYAPRRGIDLVRK